jgi:type VI secretion system protein ImpB
MLVALGALIDARGQLNNLMTYMDGKTGAEQRIGELLKDPALLQALASAPKQGGGEPRDVGETVSDDETVSE